MLEELQQGYQVHYVDVWKGDQFKPAFQRLNPNGKIPVLAVPRGGGVPQMLIFESGAILVYLAEQSGRFLPPTGATRYEALQWLMLQVSGVGPALGQHVHFTRIEPAISDYARSRYTTEAIRILDVLEERCRTAPYLGGDEYSIADIATYPWIAIADDLGLSLEERPNVRTWVDDIAQRPAAQRMWERWSELRGRHEASVATVSQDDQDRLFGRGRFARTA